MRHVLDASAVLALVHGEPGGDRAKTYLPGAMISAPGLVEVYARLLSAGMPASAARDLLDLLSLEVVPLDEAAALAVAMLAIRPEFRDWSRDEICSAGVAISRGAPLVTATPGRRGGGGFDLVALGDPTDCDQTRAAAP